ncbi:MAG: chemotaxis protein CheX [SAR324 cluster bacterium]|nr:chemotaxis protein CheX [SAR324 cluster bacterium]
MSETVVIMSKVLVHETNTEHAEWLKHFFAENQLVGLKASSVLENLTMNIDLGALFLCESPDKSGGHINELAVQIHKTRRELPIFLRIHDQTDESQLTEDVRNACAGIYKTSDREKLKDWIQTYIFQREYPASFIRNMMQISDNAFQACFPGMIINCTSPPYLVRDRLISGELFSMISLETPWCRGYLMVQTQVSQMLKLIEQGKTIQPSDDLTKYNVNSLISELTNMIWGGFKNKFINDENVVLGVHRSEIPIVINHEGNYISFGSVKPQLCLHYTLQDADGNIPAISIYEKLVFSLDWNLEKFQEPVEPQTVAVEEFSIELF